MWGRAGDKGLCYDLGAGLAAPHGRGASEQLGACCTLGRGTEGGDPNLLPAPSELLLSYHTYHISCKRTGVFCFALPSFWSLPFC